MLSGVVIRNLTIGYGDEIVLRHVTMSVGRGEGVWLKGRNGSGKSTLLKALAGQADIKDGDIVFADGSGAAGGDAIRRGLLWYVPQKSPLFDSLTIAEHLKLIAGSRNLLEPELERRVRTFALRFDFEESDLFKRTARQFSFGQRKALSISLGLSCTPHLLLLDEPFAGMSDRFIEVAVELLTEYRLRGEGSVILVEHRSEPARRSTTRAFLAEKGGLQQVDVD